MQAIMEAVLDLMQTTWHLPVDCANLVLSRLQSFLEELSLHMLNEALQGVVF